MVLFRADLHCHTTCSDGTFSPSALVDLAVEIGLTGLSITDHDTISAYPEALASAAGRLPLVSGCEFSAEHEGASVHILAYAFPLSSELIADFCRQHAQRRRLRAQRILEKLAGLNIKIDPAELPSDATSSVGRPHIAQALIRRGAASSIKDAFVRYLSRGAPAYIPGEPFSVETTLKTIKEAGGLAILAHPHLISHSRLARNLVRMPFDGLECYYSLMPRERESRWLQIANDKKWIITGGSDFHGTVKEHVPLGCSWTPEETFLKLQEHQARHG